MDRGREADLRSHWFLSQNSDPGIEGRDDVFIMRSIDRRNNQNVQFLLFKHFSEIILLISFPLFRQTQWREGVSLRRDKLLLLVDLILSGGRCDVSSFLNLDHIAQRAGRKVGLRWRWCRAVC
jgi:hypothetical protein